MCLSAHERRTSEAYVLQTFRTEPNEYYAFMFSIVMHVCMHVVYICNSMHILSWNTRSELIPCVVRVGEANAEFISSGADKSVVEICIHLLST